MPTKEEYRQRIITAAGARQAKELADALRPKRKRSRRARGDLGERLACGCVPEDEVGKDLVKWGDSVGIILHWTRSERQESARQRNWAAVRGARRGVPDYIVLSHPGIALELKAECAKHDLSKSQKRMIPYMQEKGWRVLVAHGLKDAAQQLLEATRK